MTNERSYRRAGWTDEGEKLAMHVFGDRTGLVFVGDPSTSVALSDYVMSETFSAGLWDHVNARAKVLIDEYEEEDVPVAKLNEVAVAIRSFMVDGPPLDVSTRNTLNKVVELLELAIDEHRPVRFAF